MTIKQRLFGAMNANDCKHDGLTLYQLFTAMTSLQDAGESVDDYLGDVRITPQIIIDLVLCVEQLDADLALRTAQLNAAQAEIAGANKQMRRVTGGVINDGI